jgi:hypothetical protein
MRAATLSEAMRLVKRRAQALGYHAVQLQEELCSIDQFLEVENVRNGKHEHAVAIQGHEDGVVRTLGGTAEHFTKRYRIYLADEVDKVSRVHESPQPGELQAEQIGSVALVNRSMNGTMDFNKFYRTLFFHAGAKISIVYN